MKYNDSDKARELAKEIMLMTKDSLIVNFRFMDIAINKLNLMQVDARDTLCTDSKNLIYDPVSILRLYKKNTIMRAYLHVILHCVFQHFYVDSSTKRTYWDLAADMAVENIINELEYAALTTGNEEMQNSEISEIKKHNQHITAESLYRYFIDSSLRESEIERLSEIFRYDNHDIWYENADKSARENSNGNGNGNDDNKSGSSYSSVYADLKTLHGFWKDVAEHMQMDLQSFGKRRGSYAGSLTQNLAEVTREKYDYAAFLKKFAVMGEAMKINDDEFDYIFYTYGLTRYKNIPLIEPLEYKEEKRIKEFAIAIDTSGSTSGDLVQKFIQKTYNILKQEESFFTKINLHIIQCDAEIQEDCKITSQEEFDRYINSMKIRGLGGTDFRPVFSYVNHLLEIKEFKNLKGLIYFTDGYGTFPNKRPDYYTAIVYIDDGLNNPQVPAWAIKLILKPEEI